MVAELFGIPFSFWLLRRSSTFRMLRLSTLQLRSRLAQTFVAAALTQKERCSVLAAKMSSFACPLMHNLELAAVLAALFPPPQQVASGSRALWHPFFILVATTEFYFQDAAAFNFAASQPPSTDLCGRCTDPKRKMQRVGS